ncbi:conserved hypothetical protein [Perkinsus marinus ATCC 50983]|uniref:Reverse transcriptase domain-containing protein n=1 Tax=Perkinsus marinus (strain ATCC 50983 / TXsc) TaxID=423536 RepID=C5KJJ2_PERM5|nr:conserved hypothetical protein [Perkinsus marinus ATCC 50983]EER15326.1 conserved hypothetical protein [Perkinsus marinus ATCC 50983]|eukprot:XP_002783530.1 conserved hypothetical protein [Perkinsus marinus ATCC 50983]
MRKLDGVKSCPGKPWFSASHVGAAVSEKRLKWKAFLSRKTPEAFKSYREARSNIENAEAQHAVGDVKRLINELKSGLGFTLTHRRHDLLSPQVFASHFTQLFAPKTCTLPALEPVDLPIERTGGDDITLDEVKDSLCSMDNGKAPGANGVLTSALKAGGEHCLRILHRLCKEWWSEPETIPRALGHSIIIPFYKKGDRKVAGNYRGINLLDHIGKVYSGVLGQRLKPLAESFVGEKQFGFLPAKGTLDAVHVLRRYLKAAFDKVPRPAIWRALRLAGCDEKLISAIESLHHMGTRQGCRIAPLLFIIFMGNG